MASDVYMQTMHCKNVTCLSKVRVGRFLKEPNTRVGALGFCPVCGSEAYPETDNEETYWETLAHNWDLPVNLLREIYNMWDRNEYARLYDFVQHLRAESKKVKVIA